MDAPIANHMAPTRTARAAKQPSTRAANRPVAITIEIAASGWGPIRAPRPGASTEYAGRWWPPYHELSHSEKPTLENRLLR